MPPHRHQNLALLLRQDVLRLPAFDLNEPAIRLLHAPVLDDAAVEVVVDLIPGFVEELLVQLVAQAWSDERRVSEVLNDEEEVDAGIPNGGPPNLGSLPSGYSKQISVPFGASSWLIRAAHLGRSGGGKAQRNV